MPRLSMNGAVYVNGLLVGTGGSFNEPVARNWNRPLYFLIPPGVLKDGMNRVHVRVRGYAGLDGGLSAPVVDTDASIADDYDRERALLDCFAGHLKPEQSLCFFYAKQVPFVEDAVPRLQQSEGRNRRRTERLRPSYVGIFRRPPSMG